MNTIFAHLNREALMTMVSSALYLTLLGGILLLTRRRIAALIDIVRSARRLRPERAPGAGYGAGPLDPLFAHLDQVIDAAMKRPISPLTFPALTIVCFFTVFIVSAKTLAPGAAFITGTAFAGLPYLYLRTRLERIRRVGSFEGEKLMSAFLTSYLVCNCNVYETLERVVAACPHLKVTSRLLAQVLLALRRTGDPARVKAAADAFAFGVGTSWASMLAYVITTGAVRGTDMTAAVEDILAQLREARALAEERKRINGESVRMAAYLTPGLYIGSVFVSIFAMGMSPAQFLYNQFCTAGGFAFFSAGLFLFLLNRVLLEVMTNRKLDF